MDIDSLKEWRVVPDRLRYWATTDPDRPFVQCGERRHTFGETDTITDAVAAGLTTLGIRKGDRVAIFLPNSEDYVFAILALAKIGAIQVPLNIYLKGDFLSHQLSDCQARAVISDRTGLAEIARIRHALPDLEFFIGSAVDDHCPADAVPFDSLRNSAGECPVVTIDPRDTLAIMYTSGTTGPSKGCVLSHGYYMYLPWIWFENDWYRFSDRLFTAVPLFHISGQGMTLMSALLGGMPVTISRSFSASRFLAECRGVGATAAFGVGPMGMAILATPEDRSDRDHDLRVAIFPPLPPADRDAFEARFGIPVVTDAYGQTECNPIGQSPLGRRGTHPGSLGRPVPYLDVRLVDADEMPVPVGAVGEIVVRPRHPMMMFDGYWRNPEATVMASRDLWHHTGDLARFDDDGYLVFVDRQSDSMRRRGENISSAELEAAITRHPGITAVATHAVPSPLGDDDVKAWIVAGPGAEFTPEELHEFFAANLPYFAVPRYVEFVDALPTNALGRVTKYVLRARGNDNAWDFEALQLTIAKAGRR